MLGACWAPGLTRALRGESEWVSITVGCTWKVLTCACASAYQNVTVWLGRRGCGDSDLHNKAEREILGERSGEERRRREKHSEDALAQHDQRDTYGSTEAEPDALRSPDET